MNRKVLTLTVSVAAAITLTAGGVFAVTSLNSAPSEAVTKISSPRPYISKSTPTLTPTPSPAATEAPIVDEPVRPQPEAPAGVEAAPQDAPNNISIYTPPAGFIYVQPRMVNVTAGDVPSWISFETNNDNEQSGETEESWNSSLYAYYNNKFGQTYQYDPIEVHAHWWGEPAVSPDHDAIVNYIDNRDALTVNFVVSANRVTSMMPLSWMATTTGYRNPWAWKMEIDPRLGDDVYKTVAALMYIVEVKNSQLANEPIRLHKEFYPTGCADIDVNYLRAWVDRFATGEYDINTGEPTVQTPEPSPSESTAPAVIPSPSAAAV